MPRLTSPKVINVEDLRRLAKRRLPRVIFDYVDGGADDEVTLRENSRAFQDICFRPHNAVALAHCDSSTRTLGHALSLPVLLAPLGYSRLMHPRGELAAAAAAGRAGVGYILSTFSGHRLEDVKAASVGPVWFQLYMVGGRQIAESTIERAHTAGYSGLVITIDTAVAGMRERDFRNGVQALLGGSLLAKVRY
ncbi:MAG TPA: alpha-hydroxy acid oxidase, partial [Terriglobales bacterium]